MSKKSIIVNSLLVTSMCIITIYLKPGLPLEASEPKATSIKPVIMKDKAINDKLNDGYSYDDKTHTYYSPDFEMRITDTTQTTIKEKTYINIYYKTTNNTDQPILPMEIWNQKIVVWQKTALLDPMLINGTDGLFYFNHPITFETLAPNETSESVLSFDVKYPKDDIIVSFSGFKYSNQPVVEIPYNLTNIKEEHYESPIINNTGKDDNHE